MAAAFSLAGTAAVAADEEPAPAPFSYTEVSDAPRLALADAQSSRVETVRWTQSGAHAVGVGFGLGTDVASFGPPRATLRQSVGLRWRSDLGNRQRLDVATWRDIGARREAPLADGDDTPPVTTRVEMQFAPQKARGFGPELGAIGFQMSSNAKLQLKVRKGGPMVYYRSKF